VSQVPRVIIPEPTRTANGNQTTVAQSFAFRAGKGFLLTLNKAMSLASHHPNVAQNPSQHYAGSVLPSRPSPRFRDKGHCLDFVLNLMSRLSQGGHLVFRYSEQRPLVPISFLGV